MVGGKPRYQRVILKLSGEGLCPPGGSGLQRAALERVAGEISAAAKLGVQIGVVCGGGNFFRGAQFADELGVERATADYMWMLATVLNAVALQDTLERLGQPTRVQSALAIQRVCEPFDRQRCLRHLAKGRVVILAAGTGNPHVTTDSCGAMRAAELKADLLAKATKVDGVYDDDPARNAHAKRFETVTYDQVIDGRLRVMDVSATEICQQYNIPVIVLRVMDVSATEICQQYNIPVIVFNLFNPGTFRRILLGEPLGTRMGPA